MKCCVYSFMIHCNCLCICHSAPGLWRRLRQDVGRFPVQSAYCEG